MNQMGTIGFGTDNAVLAGYAQKTNDRLGVFDLLVKNVSTPNLGVGNQPTAGASGPVLRLQLKEWDGTTSPSGWKNIGSYYEIVAGGTTTIHCNMASKKLGFFGSGYAGTSGATGVAANSPAPVAANISVVMDNKSDLRGAQIDIVVTGRKGWGVDDGFNKGELYPNWGTVDPASGNITGIKNG